VPIVGVRDRCIGHEEVQAGVDVVAIFEAHCGVLGVSGSQGAQDGHVSTAGTAEDAGLTVRRRPQVQRMLFEPADPKIGVSDLPRMRELRRHAEIYCHNQHAARGDRLIECLLCSPVARNPGPAVHVEDRCRGGGANWLIHPGQQRDAVRPLILEVLYGYVELLPDRDQRLHHLSHFTRTMLGHYRAAEPDERIGEFAQREMPDAPDSVP
jgi:hypothetical protein